MVESERGRRGVLGEKRIPIGYLALYLSFLCIILCLVIAYFV